MKSIQQMNFEGGFRNLTKNAFWTKKTNDEKKDNGRTNLNKQRGMTTKPHAGVVNNNFQFLDSKHLEMLDLNKNIVNMLPKPMKPLINLENLCKETTEAAIQNRSKLTGLNAQKSGIREQRDQLKQETYNYVNNIYTLENQGNNIGTYIQPLYNSKSFDVKGNAPNQFSPFGSASPFFCPPKFHNNKMAYPPNKFSPMPMNSQCTNLYGISDYLIPENKPQKFTITVVPNKNKDMLEKKARYLKHLLDSASEGIVNSTPHYQNVIPPSYFSKNSNIYSQSSQIESINSSTNLSNNVTNSNNDIGSDFSFGKTDNLESTENNQEALDSGNNSDNAYNSVNSEFSGSNERFEKTNDLDVNNQSDQIHLNSSKSTENNSTNSNPKVNSIYTTPNKFNERLTIEEKYKDLEDRYGKLYGDRYKNSKSNTKVLPARKIVPEKKKESEQSLQNQNQEPATHLKKNKGYFNIRLGKPKKMYDTNSSDPIDKKLKEWHNSHNSQVGWRKLKRATYAFGKSEVVLILNHNKLIVKQINGKPIKNNLLTLEKFVSLNELFELEQEQNAN
ncbi:conserved protein, unknown function [Hepatocystis sp. ex Piliocolobus tephrosceles]|nr:conserved protein, unknown function [Hepatocystis sp. ex Piliocolobus tephrosceles]